MMLQTLVFICAFALWCQGSLPSSPAAAADCVTALEKKRLAAETNIDGRVKIYREISERLHQTVQTAVARQGFDELPPLVGCWQEQLAASLKDSVASR